MTHYLKTWPEFFQAVLEGRKTFEKRVNDRDYAEGHTLVLQEFDPATQIYSGREVTKDCGFILHGPDFGVADGECIISLLEPLQMRIEP